jgi:hypothetical protein
VSILDETGQFESRPLGLPNVSYGPFRLLEAVPWLMLATACRFIAPPGALGVVAAHSLSSVCIFLAFLLAARRMIEFSGARASFGKLEFREQLTLAREVLLRIAALIVVASVMGLIVPILLGFPTLSLWVGGSLIWGLDCVAFDSFNIIEKTWSASLGTMMFLMIVGVRHSMQVSGRISCKVSLSYAVRQFAARVRYMGPGFLAVLFIQISLSAVQGSVRGVVLSLLHAAAPALIKKSVYFCFVFGFASVRLWATLAVLVFAWRLSRRADFQKA